MQPMCTDSVTRVEEKERRGSVSEDESAAKPMAEVIDAKVAVAVHRGVTSGNCTVVGFRGVAKATSHQKTALTPKRNETVETVLPAKISVQRFTDPNT